MALTPAVKVKVRKHLGYLNVGEASTFVLGIPAAVQTQFQIEGAFSRILPEAEDEVVRLVEVLDGILQEIIGSGELADFTSVDEIGVRPDSFQERTRRYAFFQGELANLFGVQTNPYDFRQLPGAPGGINVPVRH